MTSLDSKLANTVAIMQPYVFPYIGYFCLIQASDIFVFYDDVNFINRGWINRNQILVNGDPYKFTIPLSNGSQNELICNVKMHAFEDCRKKLLKQIYQSYCKTPHFDIGFNYVEEVLKADFTSISDVAISSVEKFYKLIGIEQKFIRSSEAFQSSRGADKADRLIEITKSLQSNLYVNAIGGAALYNKSYFLESGINLSFVKPRLRSYKQMGAKEFISGLSIIDVVMNNDVDSIIDMVGDYEFL
ncbi:MAG TPA: WbqC family protein [Herbaspirillum sp.]